MRGKFVVIDGIDGAGKSTAINAVSELLEQRGVPFIVTREPGGTPLAEEIREVILRKRDEPVDANTELLMMFAARSQHLKTRIIPALDEGKWVISDRFTSTTKAYQGYGRGLSLKSINMLENLVQGKIRPDMTLILDLDPEIGKQRTSLRGDENRLDLEEREFMQKVRQGLLAQASQEPERFGIVDATQDQESVAVDLQLLVQKMMEADVQQSKDMSI